MSVAQDIKADRDVQAAALDTRPYLRRPDAARYLGISIALLAKLATTGSGPQYALLGRVAVYARADLDGWFAARRRSSTSHDIGS